MTLSDLICNIDGRRVDGDESTEVTGVTADSRAVRSGDVFVAVVGTVVDGHAFVEQAIARGAAAIVVEKAVASATVPTVVVDSTARALAVMAAAYYGNPSAHLTMCGITGTNGKTSTAHMVRTIVDGSSLGTMGIVGTLGHGVENLTSTVHTTPDAMTLHRLFREMVDAQCFGVVMEVSSHAVRQHRTWGLDFEVGILTNVTHDHLDFHKSMDDYRAAKEEFCNSLVAPQRRTPPGTLVYSLDDPVARAIGGRFCGRKVAVGASASADARIVSVEATLENTKVHLRLQDGRDVNATMKLLGTFVATNASLAAAAAMELGATAAEIEAGLEAIAGISGRFEAFGGGGKPVVIIDYSHTPDALERVLTTCRELGPDRLVVVFGCGGDRDRAKRPLMGEVAQRLSDQCFLTMDNPRTESVESIIDDILEGMDQERADVTVELDRGIAIARAIATAGSKDVVALLGKGSEGYQIVGDERFPFSERRQAEDALESWGGS